VTTHDRLALEKPSARPIPGSATLTIDVSTTSISCVSTRNVTVVITEARGAATTGWAGSSAA
jgi:hypothetical protein